MSLNVLFHSNAHTIRGTEVALYDYAHYNETILKNNSYIVYDKNCKLNENLATQKFLKRFPNRVFCYEKFEDFDILVKAKNIDFCYFIKSGENDGKMSKIKPNGIHSVFQAYEPHGNVYAYVSEWLSNKMTNNTLPYVPHIIDLPSPKKNIREKINIPQEDFVFGRYGGFYEFNIDFVKEAISEFVEKNNKTWFIFFNTQPFISHPRIKFYEGFTDLQYKADIINSCDAMIHARLRGESFGLSICEFLHLNKPVLSWKGGLDLNHTTLIEEKYLYYDKNDLLNKMKLLVEDKNSPKFFNKRTHEFSPSNVMEKFNNVFLRNI